MFDPYHDIFERRGLQYHEAMTRYPDARAEEFRRVLEVARIPEGGVVCDVPAGGGYLQRFLGPRARLISVETCGAFARLCRRNGLAAPLLGTMDEIPLRGGSVDTVISLAALHRVMEKRRFYRETHRILRPGGVLCIADVWRHSPVARFLNEFVDAGNSMGHGGDFLGEEVAVELGRCGFAVASASLTRYPWTFDSWDDMARFCKLLFGLDRADHDRILEGIERYLGTAVIGGKPYLNWELLFVRAVKDAAGRGESHHERAMWSCREGQGVGNR